MKNIELKQIYGFPDATNNFVEIRDYHYLSVFKNGTLRKVAKMYDGLSDTTTVYFDGKVELVVDHEHFCRPFELKDIDSLIVVINKALI